MIKMSRKAKKAMAVALTAGMLASTAATPVMAATQGWKQNSKGWWYQNADGSYPANKWSQINGVWYYFDANGYMLANSWVKDSKGDWYYVGANGAMLKNAWAKDKAGLWYWLTDDGSMFEGGWAKINGEWYFFNADGVMQSGVVKVEGETYYLGGNDQGWMQTGKVNVAGTEYNFGTDGACTDTAAPAAAKAFDKKGNEIAPEVDVEAVDGITGTITNALADYKAEYGSVLIAGSDAYLKVLVSDKNGKPVANTPVSLMGQFKILNNESVLTPFQVKGLNVQNTDANGYATFVIGASSSLVTPTSGDYALIELTATAVATNQVYKTDLAFATVALGEVDVLNDNDKNDSLLEKISQNAPGTASVVVETTTIDGAADTEYVASQQVNEKGTTTNKVQLKLDPQIKIPYANATSVVDKYQKDVNKEIKEYSVYQNGGSTSFKVEGIPAGLKYATLNFSSIDVSDYTKVVITAYKAGSGTVVETYEIDGPTTQKNFGYQIPVQKNTALDIEVKVISEGQVDDNQNAGLVVTDVTGLYDTKTSDDVKTISLKDSVTWSVVENKYSNAKTLTAAEAAAYIPDEMDAKYTAEGNTYSYQVPVYPYTGNAVLTVKDVNKKVVGYFTIPTENITKVVSGDVVYQNENDIVDANNQAILVSYDEAFNNVGAITADGNTVEVNSEATGITALQAKINLAGFENEINLTNNTVYTSVHWSPIPTTKSIDQQNFYALAGQSITVKAQLVDNNGNKVAQSGEQITYYYDNNKEITERGAVGTTKATATSYTQSTDANGQATLKLTSGDFEALVKLLHAESKNYNVQLVIGDTMVSNANLRWVKPGLEFTSSVDEDDEDYEVASTLEGDTELDNVLAKEAESSWIFGYEVVGLTQDDDIDDAEVREVVSIEGLKVDVTKGGDGEITTTGMANGTAKLSSKKAGATTLTGTLNKNSVVSGTPVIFNVKENGTVNRYTNVGEGNPSINESLNLPITWGTVGTAIEIVTPKGSNIMVDGSDTTYEAYIKVKDTTQGENPITTITKDNVEVKITYSNGSSSASETLVLSEDQVDTANGLVKVSLKNSVTPASGADFSPKTATIAVKFGNVETEGVIDYASETNNAAEFALATAKYEFTDGANPQVKLYFTAPVNPETLLNKNMFSIVNTAGKNVDIKSAKVSDDNKVVILTLGDVHKTTGLDSSETYTVTVGSITDKGITYDLCDTHGRTIITDAYKTTTFDTVASNLDVTITAEGAISFKINGQAQSGQEVLCVYDSATDEVLASETTGIYEATATFTRNDSKLTAPLSVTFYYDGAVVTKVLQLTTAEKTAVAQTKLTGLTFAVPSATYKTGATVTVPTLSGYTAEITAVTDTNNIFAAWTTGDLKIADTLAENTANTATVTVTYTDATYPTVTKDVVYDVTLTDGADDDTKADAIVFKAQ